MQGHDTEPELAWISTVKFPHVSHCFFRPVRPQNDGLGSQITQCEHTQGASAACTALCAHRLCAALCQEGESSEEEAGEEESETMTVSECLRDDQYDEKMEEDEQMLERYKQERMDEMFPDEVDTPRDVPARVR